MNLQPISYDELNPRQKENYNFQKSAAILADYGFNCIKLADDWQGADFLADHIDGTQTLRVQLKGRVTIDKKYIGQDLYMNFKVAGTWYLVPHDELIDIIGQATNWLNTQSWQQEHGAYSSNNPSLTLLEKLRPFALDTIPEPGIVQPQATAELPLSSVDTGINVTEGSHSEAGNPQRGRANNIKQAAVALAQAGYDCTPPSRKLTDVDILAQHKGGTGAIKVRCPGRAAIYKGCLGQSIYLSFQDQNGVWYLIPHDELVSIAGETTPWLDSHPWRVDGWYSSAKPSARMRDGLRPFALNAGP